MSEQLTGLVNFVGFPGRIEGNLLRAEDVLDSDLGEAADGVIWILANVALIGDILQIEIRVDVKGLSNELINGQYSKQVVRQPIFAQSRMTSHLTISHQRKIFPHPNVKQSKLCSIRYLSPLVPLPVFKKPVSHNAFPLRLNLFEA